MKFYYFAFHILLVTCNQLAINFAQAEPSDEQFQSCNGSLCMQGMCLEVNSIKKCLCYQGFTGQSCQIAIDGSDYPCSSNPCTAGRCISYQVTGGSAYFCKCPLGMNVPECYNSTTSFQAQACPSSCTARTCENSGVCNQYYSYATTYCTCPSGSTGRFCEQNFQPACTPNTCQNNGICHNSYNNQNYHCHCKYPFTGKNCEYRLGCSSNPCLNGGNCIEIAPTYSYRCSCSLNFTGVNCEEDYNDPCDPNPCSRYGVCVRDNRNFTCRCQQDYRGPTCSYNYREDGSIRLYGNTPQIYQSGYWGYICVDSINYYSVGRVICHLTGYRDISYVDSYYGYSTYFTMSYPNCQGNEHSLFQCNYGRLSQSPFHCSRRLAVSCYNYGSCSSYERSQCAISNKLCQPASSGYSCYCPKGYTGTKCETYIEASSGAIRIRNQNYTIISPASNKTSSGILEIFYKGYWGGICDSNDENVAMAACRQLGFSAGKKSSTCCSSVYNSKIWVKDMHCSSDASAINQCSFMYGTNTNNCNRPMKVECQRATCNPNPCQNGGNCTLSMNGTNPTIISYSCSCMPGYIGENCQYRDPCFINPCKDSATCSVHNVTEFRCACRYPYVGKRCDLGPYRRGSVALMDGSSYRTYGRVRLYSRFGSRALCRDGMTMAVAHVICQSNNLAGALAISYGISYGYPSYSYGASNGQCTGYETSLSECPYFNFDSNNYCRDLYVGVQCSTTDNCASNPCQNDGKCINMFYGYRCNCTNQYAGTMCQFNTSSVTPGFATLVNGSTRLNGKAEIFLDNQWATVCSDTVTEKDLRVICRQMGYVFASSRIISAGSNNTNNSSLYYSRLPKYNLRCVGNEKSIIECPYQSIKDPKGCSDKIVKITCTGYQKDGDIRLDSDDDTKDYEGFVQVFYNGTWGTVCNAQNRYELAGKMCIMLGYSSYSSFDFRQSTDMLGPVMLSNVSCTGNARNLYQCDSAGWHSVPNECQDHGQDFYIRCSLSNFYCRDNQVSNCKSYNKYCIPMYNSPNYQCRCPAGFTGQYCETKYVPPVEGSIQLAYKVDYAYNKAYGVPLLYHNGIWGGFCLNGFSAIEGRILCRQMGFTDYLSRSCCHKNMSTHNKIWVTKAQCTDKEKKITQCKLTYETDANLCDGNIRLYCTRQLCPPGYCDRGTCTYNTSIADDVTSYHQYCICPPGYYGNRCQYQSVCDSNPCLHGGTCTNKFRAHPTFAGVILSYYECQCQQAYFGSSCEKGPAKHGDIDLVRPSVTSPDSTGRVRVYLHGNWYSICNDNFTTSAANVVCQQLRYGKSLIYSNRYGESLTGRMIRNLRCTGYEFSISQCQYSLDNITTTGVCQKENAIGVSCASLYNPCHGISCNLGVCRNMAYGFKCDCHEYFTGLRCETYLGPPFEGDIRLRNGKTITEGRIEIYRGNQWNTICGSASIGDIGRAVCYQYKYSYTETVYNAYFGTGKASLGILSSNCSVNAPSTTSCLFQNVTNMSSECNHGNDLGVICSIAEGTLRLKNGTTSSGNLEIYHSNSWGAVCDIGFTKKAAEVACKQLGFIGMQDYFCCSNFGFHSGTFWLHGLNCKGDESRLIDYNACYSNPCSNGGTCIGSNNGPGTYKYNCRCPPNFTGKQSQSKLLCSMNPCGSNATCQDLPYGYSCYCPDGFHGQNCSERVMNGDVRLSSRIGDNNVRQGTVQIYQNGTWGSICDETTFNIQAASVICRQLNFPYATAYYKSSYFGPVPGKIIYGGVTCKTGNEDSITKCNLNRHIPGQCDYNDLIGIDCSGNACESSPCISGVCERLKSKPFYRCTCHPSYTGRNCETALVAEPARIVGGPNRYTGRLEVLYNGTWGGICDYRFTKEVGQVACKQLGFKGFSSNWCCSRYGYPQSILLSNITCRGDEISLSNCQRNPWGGSQYCSRQNSVSVACYGSPCTAGVCPNNATCIEMSGYNETGYTCECPPDYYGSNCQIGPVANGAVRFNSQYYSSDTGLVQVFINGEWGSICSDGFTANSGEVICRAVKKGKFVRQLSYNHDRNTGKILFSNLKCNGTENSPIECPRSLPNPSRCNSYNKALVIECTNSYCDSTKNPCSGHGTCHSSNETTYNCVCDPLYTGKDCAIYYTPCSSNPCASQASGRAICVDHLDKNYYSCECPKGYSGYNCLFYSEVIGIRVTDGVKYNQGLMEVYKDKAWGTTCSSQWKYSAAQVACRQLGFANMQLSWGPWRFIQNENVRIAVGSFNCTGNEPNLNHCGQSNELLNQGSKCRPNTINIHSDVSCVDEPLDSSLRNAKQLPPNYTCQTAISPCASSPCIQSNTTCANVMQPSVGYTCICSSGYWNGQKCITEIPPSAVTLEASVNLVTIGQMITLECSAYGRPRPTISWLKNGRPIYVYANPNMTKGNSSNNLVTKSTYFIRYAIPSYKGVYTCQATNMANSQLVTSNSQTIRFNCSSKYCSDHGQCTMVNDTAICSNCNIGYIGTHCEIMQPYVPLRAVSIQSNVTDIYRLGQIIGLECQTTSYPSPFITWTKNNIPLSIGEHYTTMKRIGYSAYYEQKSVLVINGLKVTDIGIYRCEANYQYNAFGQLHNITMKTKEVAIEISCYPEICNNRGQCNQSNNAPVCSCNVPYTGQQCESSYIPKLACLPRTCLNGGNCFMIGITPVCSCVTGYAGNRCENWLQSVPLQNVQVISNTSLYTVGLYARLECQATARPKPIFTWTKNGIPMTPGNNTNIIEISSNTSAIVKSILNFRPLTFNDNGQYQCVVRKPDNTTFTLSAALNIDFSCSPSFCVNNGQCTMQNNRPTCSCSGGFQGNNCQSAVIGLNTPSIIGIAAGSAGALLILLLVAYFFMRKRGNNISSDNKRAKTSQSKSRDPIYREESGQMTMSSSGGNQHINQTYEEPEEMAKF
ncbi:uncharacterized protein TRIADDRAFT_53907 [Trichoplax adhaerens]|uniref:Deleted in malignant brain tumors 1 protein n=1 Tax=Trichoplax adhaerens TaxID=10228 RepID=B3RMD2_TRIAD|nr:hypothetical protein TRIADDRAFT_53907 [Trichoplax adhaerens]EDV28344.1 hypothetical protein TRIADDRAFT_53907 [Trichoplax adhaerens]|eukprot:XP_002110178.1 hypothetical protein TRIADDRAFT_53907 [Trichoplax adhaerens]